MNCLDRGAVRLSGHFFTVTKIGPRFKEKAVNAVCVLSAFF